jgi:hypothetical protein
MNLKTCIYKENYVLQSSVYSQFRVQDISYMQLYNERSETNVRTY